MLTRTELETFAVEGVRGRVVEIEKELAKYHKSYPNLFLSPTVPQLLKAQSKNGATPTNGHWPTLTATPAAKRGPKPGAGWTDERRKKFSATMKAKYAEKRAKKNGAHAERNARIAASWTPERRRKMARLMKKRSKAMHAAKRALRGG